jgi:hypothetical protein
MEPQGIAQFLKAGQDRRTRIRGNSEHGSEIHFEIPGEVMTTQIKNLIQIATIRVLRLTLMSSLVLSGTLVFAQHSSHHAAAHTQPSSGTLVQAVRTATAQFINVNNATAAGYGPFLGCVAGSDHGAMGVHYVNPTILGKGQLDASQPQALIYEPDNGQMRLVGVEFIVDAATWLANNNNSAPVLDGQVLNFVDAPNRFNIPSFFELHVWAWRDNPQGAFVDWNNLVSCEGQ